MRAVDPHHGHIRTARTIASLKAAYGPLPPGWGWYYSPLALGGTSVDVYRSPAAAIDTTAPERLPEGSYLVGMVLYASYEDALRDRGSI